MVARKYLGDYRLENRTDPRTGKIKTVPVYRGPWFAFAADRDTVRRAKRLYTALSALSALLFLLVLFLNAPSGRAIYVMLPFAAMVFPIFFCLAGCQRLLTAREKVTREHADKIQTRFTNCAFMMALLSAISTAGHLLYWFRFGMRLLDVLSLASAAAILAMAAVMFRKKDDLRMKQLES